MAAAPEYFYIRIKRRDGEVVEHAASISVNFEQTVNENDNNERDVINNNELENISEESNFRFVFTGLVTVMESYLRFMSLNVSVAPQIARHIGEREISDFAQIKGVVRDDISTDDDTIYEVPIQNIFEFFARSRKTEAALNGSDLLPKVMIIGLVSAYDAFLTQLLKAIFTAHQEMVFSSEKQISFKDLLEFGSIEKARTILIEREVESVIRKSHHDQFDWMQSKFKIKLKEGLDVWPEFIELCERRNLFTHTGGIVSDQYINICRDHKFNVPDDIVGRVLAADSDYYKNAVYIIYEVSMKLCYVLWRKFAPEQYVAADNAYNEHCMELIYERDYPLAEALLNFSKSVPHVSDRLRRMMIINYANALRLQGKNKDAVKEIDKHDWSATGDEFKVCVAAVTENMSKLIPAMLRADKKINATQYRRWPVFRGLRENKEFAEAFQKIFGEPIVAVDASLVSGEGGHNKQQPITPTDSAPSPPQ